MRPWEADFYSHGHLGISWDMMGSVEVGEREAPWYSDDASENEVLCTKTMPLSLGNMIEHQWILRAPHFGQTYACILYAFPKQWKTNQSNLRPWGPQLFFVKTFLLQTWTRSAKTSSSDSSDKFFGWHADDVSRIVNKRNMVHRWTSTLNMW